MGLNISDMPPIKLPWAAGALTAGPSAASGSTSPLPWASSSRASAPVSYNFTLPCPGEGLVQNWERICAQENLCAIWMFCKVCGHCLPSCSGYIDITPSSSQVTKRADVQLLPHRPKQATVPWVNAQVNARLEYDRSRKRDKRAAETPEEREARLQKMRDYNASRKVADKERKKKQLANETPEQREIRLKKVREYSASRRGG